jgi:hypothetical protein
MTLGTNNAIEHIEEQLKILHRLSNPEDKICSGGVLHGLCMAYFRMGYITQDQWLEIGKKAEDISCSCDLI